MNPASGSSSAPDATAYGFHCQIEAKDLGAAVARATEALKAEGAHEVRERLQRVRASLAAPRTTPYQG